MPEQKLKNIIFDFGGVIIDINYQKSIDAFIKLGRTDFENIYSQASQTQIFDKIDKGLISADDFKRELKKLFPEQVTIKMINDAWNEILIGIPAHRIHLLEKIRHNYRIFLMSNTNTIHYEEYIREINDNFGYDDLACLFEKVYLSFELGMRKPEKDFFRLILQDNNLNPSETLFIDDSEQNLPPAQELGINTIFLKTGQDVTSLFEDGFLKNLK